MPFPDFIHQGSHFPIPNAAIVTTLPYRSLDRFKDIVTNVHSPAGNTARGSADLVGLRSVEGQQGFTERNQHAQRPWGTNQHVIDLLCGNRDL